MNALNLFRIKVAVFCTALILISSNADALTPGMIYQSADNTGGQVLNPSGSNFASQTVDGFQLNDVEESEIPYRSIPCLEGKDPDGDNRTGPSSGFTDIVGETDMPAVSYYIDDNDNLMFRFRLGSGAPNAKGYSILLDTDGQWSGGHPFNIEIVLRTKHGVSLYDVEGDPDNRVQKVNLPITRYHQKAVALSEIGGNQNHFYDFYVPLSIINQHFPGFSFDDPMSMFASTTTSPHSAFNRTNISDVACLDDTEYGNNFTKMFEDVVTSQSGSSLRAVYDGADALRTFAPGISSPLMEGATSVSGIVDETGETEITLYKNGTEEADMIGSHIITDGSGQWQIDNISPELAKGDTLRATANTEGKTLSEFSDYVVVRNTGGEGCTEPPVITGSPQGNSRRIAGTGPGEAEIRFYVNGQQVSDFNNNDFVIAEADGSWEFDFCTNPTNNCIPCGSLTATAKTNGECESLPSEVFCSVDGGDCINNPDGFDQPLSEGATNPPGLNTANLDDTDTEVNVQNDDANMGALFIYINGFEVASQQNVAANSNHIFQGLTFEAGDEVFARAQSDDGCISNPSDTLTVTTTQQATPPDIDSPIVMHQGADTSIAGTSDEDEGALITIFDYATQNTLGTDTVNAFGSWSISGVNLTGVDSVNAIASNEPSKTQSDSSEKVAVWQYSDAPTVDAPINESDNTITGTGKAEGDSILVYVFDAFIGGTTVQSDGSWSLSGFEEYDLYAGAEVYATQIEDQPGFFESKPSNKVTVDCDGADPALTVKPDTTVEVCQNERFEILVENAENDIIYQLIDANDPVTTLSGTYAGQGENLLLTSEEISNTSLSQISVVTRSLWDPSCVDTLNESVNVSVLGIPDDNRAVNAPYNYVCSQHSVTIDITDGEDGIDYRLLEVNSEQPVSSWEPATTEGQKVTLTAGQMDSTQSLIVQAQDPSTGCVSKLLDNDNQIHRIYLVDANAGEDQNLCDNDATIQLNANDPSTEEHLAAEGVWTIETGEANDITHLSDVNDPNATIEFNKLTQDYTEFRWTIDEYDPSVCGGETHDIVAIDRTGCQAPEYQDTLANEDFWTNGDIVASPFNQYGAIVNADPTVGDPIPTDIAGLISVDASNGNISINDTSEFASALSGYAEGDTATYNFEVQVEYEAPEEHTQNTITTTVPVQISFIKDQEAQFTQEPSKPLNDYEIGDVMISADDPDGKIVKAFVDDSDPNHKFPDWAVINSDGSVTVASLPVDDGDYTYEITTIDETGGITSHTEDQSPLPVELLYFHAELDDEKTFLEWATATEINNDYFLVQRSVDGEEWEDIDKLQGQGNSPSTTFYSAYDRNVYQLPENYVFYRLKQVDFDGTYDYSLVRHIEKDPLESVDFEIHPNPYAHELYLKFEIPRSSLVFSEIYSLTGEKLATFSKEFTAGNHLWDISKYASDFEEGMYIIRLQAGEQGMIENYRLIRE